MKKQILFAMLLLMGMAVQAQDVQLHYDLAATSTLTRRLVAKRLP